MDDDHYGGGGDLPILPLAAMKAISFFRVFRGPLA